ncbi:hsp20-like chaperones superfamily protein [Anaeramoeba flamelloides]|uniref:Hsp20-like chaperones superfamily protein n=1 Tax=Anaeramoeba flamelloides TaxID=1746091 RepID=A0AAV8AGK9_9EUKA|nr:hsp20-like chaperones superfamily protein [Anaeramoeba flamelloides]
MSINTISTSNYNSLDLEEKERLTKDGSDNYELENSNSSSEFPSKDDKGPLPLTPMDDSYPNDLNKTQLLPQVKAPTHKDQYEKWLNDRFYNIKYKDWLSTSKKIYTKHCGLFTCIFFTILITFLLITIASMGIAGFSSFRKELNNTNNSNNDNNKPQPPQPPNDNNLENSLLSRTLTHQKNLMNKQQLSDDEEEHEHEHEHEHKHDDEENEEEHEHEHGHKHEHKHDEEENDHEHEPEHEEENDHEHDDDEENDHEHEPEHEHEHDHKHDDDEENDEENEEEHGHGHKHDEEENDEEYENPKEMKKSLKSVLRSEDDDKPDDQNGGDQNNKNQEPDQQQQKGFRVPPLTKRVVAGFIFSFVFYCFFGSFFAIGVWKIVFKAIRNFYNPDEEENNPVKYSLLFSAFKEGRQPFFGVLWISIVLFVLFIVTDALYLYYVEIIGWFFAIIWMWAVPFWIVQHKNFKIKQAFGFSRKLVHRRAFGTIWFVILSILIIALGFLCLGIGAIAAIPFVWIFYGIAYSEIFSLQNISVHQDWIIFDRQSYSNNI